MRMPAENKSSQKRQYLYCMNCLQCIHLDNMLTCTLCFLGGTARCCFKDVANPGSHAGGKMRNVKAGDKLTQLLSATVLCIKCQ